MATTKNWFVEKSVAAKVLESLFRVEYRDTKKLCGAEVPQVVSDDGLSLRIGGGFQHHFIGRVAQLRSPLVMRHHWLDMSRQPIQNRVTVAALLPSECRCASIG